MYVEWFTIESRLIKLLCVVIELGSLSCCNVLKIVVVVELLLCLSGCL